MEEVQVTVVDELYVEQNAEGHVDKQIARVRLFFLGFLSGNFLLFNEIMYYMVCVIIQMTIMSFDAELYDFRNVTYLILNPYRKINMI